MSARFSRMAGHVGVALVLVVSITWLPGCGSSGSEPDAQPADALDSLSHVFTVSPGGYAEVNLLMGAGSMLACDYATDGLSVSWDVHTHEGAGAVLDGGTGVAAHIEFMAEEDGGYSVLWENLTESDVRVDVTCMFGGDVELHSVVPAD